MFVVTALFVRLMLLTTSNSISSKMPVLLRFRELELVPSPEELTKVVELDVTVTLLAEEITFELSLTAVVTAVLTIVLKSLFDEILVLT